MIAILFYLEESYQINRVYPYLATKNLMSYHKTNNCHQNLVQF